MQLTSRFDIGESVHIDGDASIAAVVTKIEWFNEGLGVQYEISWFNSGEIKAYLIDEWRLSKK